MQLRISIPNHRVQIFLAFRPEGLFPYAKLRPLDITLEALASIPAHSFDFHTVKRALEHLSERGQQHEAHVVMPHAVHFAQIHCPYNDPGIETIVVNTSDRTIEAPDLPKTDLVDFCGVPADREFKGQFGREAPSMLDAKASYEELAHTVHEARSLMIGMLDAVTPGPWAPFQVTALQMAGVLVGASGRAFQKDISGPLRGGSSSMRQADQYMHETSLIVSDRGWMPRATRRSVNFDGCLKDAQPKLMSLGRELAAPIGSLDSTLAPLALLQILKRLGDDPVQHSLKDRHGRPLSNHEMIKIERVIAQVCDLLDMPLPA
jgi:hypothetical protein